VKPHTDRRIAWLANENAGLRAQLATARQQVDTMLAVNDELTTERDALKVELDERTEEYAENLILFRREIDAVTAERDSLRAAVARVMPVYEQAIRFHDEFTASCGDYTDLVGREMDALWRAVNKAKTKEQG
jgi:chromosome segregation ATPase